jgi:hypothetical protein
MFWFITLNPIINIDTIEGPLSLSIHFGGLVPGWNLVLVCWEHEIVGRHADNHLVAVWAHCLGATVTASVAANAFTTATPTAATLATTAPTAPPGISFGHSHYGSRVLLHDEVELLALSVEFGA